MLSSEKTHTCKTFSYIKDEEHLLTYLKARCKIVLNSEKLYEKQEWRQRKTIKIEAKNMEHRNNKDIFFKEGKIQSKRGKE